MSFSIAIAAATAALSFQSANPNLTAPLKPSGPWNVDYADNMCVLQRLFGPKEQSVTLGFKPGPLGESMRLVVVQPEGSAGKRQGVARIHFDEGSVAEGGFWSFPAATKKVDVTLIDLKRDQLAPLLGTKQIRIRAGKVDVSLALTAVQPALQALEACEKNLLASWGMDPATIASVVTPPRPRGGIVSFFSTNDYPSSAISRNEQGTAGVRFWVSKDGKVRDCKVAESSGSAVLDAQTCAIISRRGRFEPAQTASGEAVESIGYQRIRWEIPN